MAEPFLSEIRLFSFDFPPKGWAKCDGQLLPINQNQPLFSLLGTTYGGDGRVNFALPDLRGRTPIHQGSGHTLGERGGEQGHTLTLSELPAHTHAERASAAAGNDVGASTPIVLASPLSQSYRPSSSPVALAPTTLTATGGTQAHLNMQPFLSLNFCIALQGIFPSAT
jgi:microcystin-dependent protein